ncbi:MAG: TlpA disulfide reductase family protein [Pseudolabrys sp.]|nr:TlpA disulfide reductase family protein [Pseudolabrys sp.]
MSTKAIVRLNPSSHRRMIENRRQRRRFIMGLAATLAHLSTVTRSNAQDAAIPAFRSGRFQFTILRPQLSVPSVRLFRLDGKTIDLSSLRGRPVLLNFWASWCEACRTELPILDNMREDRRYADVQIIAVSEDRADRAVVDRFARQYRIQSLPIYLDPNGYVAFSDPENPRKAPFALYGMPVTYAISASGWIVGYMPGAADWTSPDAQRLIDFLRRS